MRKDIYLEGTTNKVRFDSPQGKTGLTMEQLFDLPLKDDNHRVANLNDIASLLDSQKKKTKDFVSGSSKTDYIAQLKFDIVINVIRYKQEKEIASLNKTSEIEAAKKQLADISDIETKADTKKLKNMSDTELAKAKREAEATILGTK